MRHTVLWNVEGVDMPAIDCPRLENWIEEVAASHGRILGDIAYIFCDDEKILEVNRQFLNHDYYKHCMYEVTGSIPRTTGQTRTE